METLRFPLLYPYGTTGYTPQLRKTDKKEQKKKVSPWSCYPCYNVVTCKKRIKWGQKWGVKPTFPSRLPLFIQLYFAKSG